MNRFGQSLLIVCVASGFADAGVAASQQPSTQIREPEARTRAIVASFAKNKHVIKERHGIRREKYKDVRSEPVVRSNLQSFSGDYEAPDMGFALHLRVSADGRVEGSGEDEISDGVVRRFELSNGRIQGALLTATKVYAGGGSERLEGVFINKTSKDSPSDKGYTEFGLGVISNPVTLRGNTFEKIFYRLER